MERYRDMTVGQIVADRFANASVFEKYGIDFCCNGSDTLADACAKRGADIKAVLADLDAPQHETSDECNFKSWPIDLLCDYILKFHHRNIRKNGPPIGELLIKVCNAHGERHPELLEVKALFDASLEDLYSHLHKEEMMLFPHIYMMYDAMMKGEKIPEFHCGSVAAPIAVMMKEHQIEGERYFRIAALTNDYQTPEDGCGSYRLLMEKLKVFNAALHQHIHLENNIVFPKALEMERNACNL